MSEIRIGTSGWSYPSGRGTWNGLFYPSRSASGRAKVDELSFYAEHFDTVEVNATFYRPPVAATARRWAERTPAGFDFSIKLYQKFTHPAMYAKSAGGAAAEPAGAVPEIAQGDVDEFRLGIDPIVQAGKLAAVLVQFPPSFKQTPETIEYVRSLLSRFAGYPLAVELRHRTWSDDQAGTLRLLNAFGAAWVQIDEPKFRFSVRQNYQPNVEGVFYMRLHGRNAAKWWEHEQSEDRYDYLYTPEELKPLVATAAAAGARVRKSYVYLNNHFAAKAVVNAAVLKHGLGQPITGEYLPELVAAYPVLRDLLPGTSSPSSATLFPG